MVDEPDRLMTSDTLALHDHTNPVVVRRVLGMLRAQGLVRSAKGQAGGWQLARPAGQITVADIDAAIDAPVLALRTLSANPGCAIVAAMMTDIVTDAMTEAQAVLRQHFTRFTVADLAAAMGQARHFPASHPPVKPL